MSSDPFEAEALKQIGNEVPLEKATEVIFAFSKAQGVISEEVPSVISKLTGLKELSLNGIGLKSLTSLPVLPKLRKLDISDNNISDGLEHLVWVGGTPGGRVKLPSLRRLVLQNNKVVSLDSLRPLAGLENLDWLDLDPNPITSSPDYKNGAGARKMFSNLEVVDGFDKDGEEVEDMDDEEEEEEYDSDAEGAGNSDDDDEESDSDDDDAALGLSALLGDIKDDEDEADDDFDPAAPPGEDYDNDSNLEDELTEPTLATHIAKGEKSSSGAKRKFGDDDGDGGGDGDDGGLNPSDLFGGGSSSTAGGLEDNDDTRTKKQKN